MSSRATQLYISALGQRENALANGAGLVYLYPASDNTIIEIKRAVEEEIVVSDGIAFLRIGENDIKYPPEYNDM